MKRVGRVLLAVCVCWSLLAGHLLAQSINPQVKQSPSIDQASRQAIELAISQNIQKLSDQNPSVQRAGREGLINELRLPGGEPSAAFMAAYAEALGNAVMKLPKDTPVLTLLNAAIAVQRVAEITKSTRLEPVIVWLLSPEQPEAVKLWGMKAARAIMPALAKIPNNKLLGQIVPTVQAHPSGAMTAEAYEALLVDNKAVIDELLNLVQVRLSLYGQATAPEDPQVDYTPFASMLSVKGWPNFSQPQRVRVMQAICSLLVLGARHADAAPPGTVEKEQLQQMVQGVARALQAIGLQLQHQQLQNVAGAASRAVELTPAVKQICPVIKQIKGFESVQEPSLGGAGVEAAGDR